MANNQHKIPIPPPLIFVFCALLMKMLPPVWQFLSSLWLVIVLGGMGCVIGMASVLQFLFAKTTIDPLKIEKTSQLVTNGIYQYSRNPMYLGLAFVLLAWNGAKNILVGDIQLAKGDKDAAKSAYQQAQQNATPLELQLIQVRLNNL